MIWKRPQILAVIERSVWIFAYGSLLWRPGFAFHSCRSAILPGWKRRFWQGSPDHRGTKSHPGRVVTLVPQASAVCVGMVYQLDRENADEIMRALDVREQGGYVREQLQVSLENRQSIAATTWIAHSDNQNFLGPTTHSNIASHIASSAGPSGSNIDYFERLLDALSQLNVREAHTRRISRWLPGRKLIVRQV